MRKKIINLILCITLIICFTLLSIVSCTPETEKINNDIEYIKYGTSFGFCAGYCINTNTITASEVTLEKSSWPVDNFLPKITYTEKLDETVLDDLFEKVDFDAFLNLDEFIGCPDCADGGAEWVEINANNQTHKVTFEYLTDQVPVLDALLEPLREINTSLQKDAYLILDNTVYNNTLTDHYVISALSLDGDILKISISSGGCSGNSWVVNLIDSEELLESTPVQRNLKINFVNNEACLAQITKDYEIDLSQLQIDGTNELHLNIEGWNQPIVYTY